MPYLDIVRSDRTKLRLRVLAYLGYEKVNYLLRHKSFLASWVCSAQEHLLRQLKNWRNIVENVHGDMLSALEDCGRTRKSSPKNLLRGVVRFIIVCKRSREAFYAPESGKYIKQGERQFEQRVKRQKF